MFKNLFYLKTRFDPILIAFEATRQFTACIIPDKTIKPFMFKQVKVAIANECIVYTNGGQNEEKNVKDCRNR
jgi:hypothetical protein